MISVVEFVIDREFADVQHLKRSYFTGINEYLSRMGYGVEYVDKSEWYSYEKMLLMDTDAPEPLIDDALRLLNLSQKDVMGVLVR